MRIFFLRTLVTRRAVHRPLLATGIRWLALFVRACLWPVAVCGRALGLPGSYCPGFSARVELLSVRMRKERGRFRYLPDEVVEEGDAAGV